MMFGLVQSFDVDDGTLDGLSAVEAFTLGVEWGRAWELVRLPAPFALVVHARNSDRISAMLIKQGRSFNRSGLASDKFVELSVAGLA